MFGIDVTCSLNGAGDVLPQGSWSQARRDQATCLVTDFGGTASRCVIEDFWPCAQGPVVTALAAARA